MQNGLYNEVFKLLISEAPRVPALCSLLTNSVWCDEKYSALDSREYFSEGEKIVRDIEELITFAASGVFDELVSLSNNEKKLLPELEHENTALVILDGASIRILPVLKKLASDTGFSVLETDCRISVLPSETASFVEQRLIGKPVAPAQLSARKELKDRNIKTFYYDSVTRSYDIPSDGSPLLLWSRFPDATYMNFEARNGDFYKSLIEQFDVVFRNVILSIPRGYRIIITSDHGYVHLSSSFQSDEPGLEALKFLEQNRFRFYNQEEIPPQVSELQIIPDKNLAMIRGRIMNRLQGPAASKVFRHGGLSLMEMLCPYIVIERK